MAVAVFLLVTLALSLLAALIGLLGKSVEVAQHVALLPRQPGQTALRGPRGNPQRLRQQPRRRHRPPATRPYSLNIHL